MVSSTVLTVVEQIKLAQEPKYQGQHHCDIWGSYKTASHSGAHYFLTIVDDFTRCTWVYLMRYKSETQQLLKSFFALAETQFHHKIKQIRVDNGSEFYSMRYFFWEHGIIFQHSCDTPTKWGS